ncbi:hypothetical protein FHU39_001773 [Flexivirga oryzae]|uniref:Uncharacterized protein n=1 Tax=Flexivirga oryzae TaxID=1794944 RepID=A0A839N4V9_9MICO|nr:hypothetical protein [Flexivirga oryzae]
MRDVFGVRGSQAHHTAKATVNLILQSVGNVAGLIVQI